MKAKAAVAYAAGKPLEVTTVDLEGPKAGGEGGTTPALAVIVSAIVDALRELGVDGIAMPATPFTVWQAIQAAQGKR